VCVCVCVCVCVSVVCWNPRNRWGAAEKENEVIYERLRVFLGFGGGFLLRDFEFDGRL
jgi:hypothetical protein